MEVWAHWLTTWANSACSWHLLVLCEPGLAEVVSCFPNLFQLIFGQTEASCQEIISSSWDSFTVINDQDSFFSPIWNLYLKRRKLTFTSRIITIGNGVHSRGTKQWMSYEHCYVHTWRTVVTNQRSRTHTVALPCEGDSCMQFSWPFLGSLVGFKYTV